MRASHRVATTFVALGLIAPLALAGCSKKDDQSASATTSASAAASSSSAAATSSKAAEKKDEGDAYVPSNLTDEEKEQVKKLQQDVAKQLAENPPAIAPVADGKPADTAVKDSIQELELKMLKGNTGAEVVDNVKSVTCKENLANPVIAQQLDALSQATTAGVSNPADRPTPEVANVLVNGDEASADVSVDVVGQKVTITHRYKKEDGDWKLCNPVQ